VLDYHKLRSASSLDLAEAPAGNWEKARSLSVPICQLPAASVYLAQIHQDRSTLQAKDWT